VGLGSFLLALAVVGCSNEKTAFSSKAADSLLSDRNSDGTTSEFQGNTVYAATDASVADADVADSELNYNDAVAATPEQPSPGVEAVLTSEKTDTSAPTASAVPTYDSEKPGNKDKDKESDKASEKAAEKTAGRPGPVAPVASEPPPPAVSSETAASCASPLGLNPAPSAADFKFELVTKLKKNGKLANANHKMLFSDPASKDTKPLFLKVSLKNVNKSSIELLDPNGLYCVDMKVKNMNKFKFKFHCDAKVVFVNLQSKKSKKSETLRAQCK
jgi:hypothetical protein